MTGFLFFFFFFFFFCSFYFICLFIYLFIRFRLRGGIILLWCVYKSDWTWESWLKSTGVFSRCARLFSFCCVWNPPFFSQTLLIILLRTTRSFFLYIYIYMRVIGSRPHLCDLFLLSPTVSSRETYKSNQNKYHIKKKSGYFENY